VNDWNDEAMRFVDRGRKAQETINDMGFGQVVEVEPIATEIIGHRYGVQYAAEAVEGLIDGFRELEPDHMLTPAEVVAVMEAFLVGWKDQMGRG